MTDIDLQASPRPRKRRRLASWFNVPRQTILTVEHPAVVNNVEKALLTLGGIEAVNKVFDDKNTDLMQLKMRPKDIMEPAVEAHVAETKNILIKVTIPKRRGNIRDQNTLLQALEASKGRYNIELVGTVDKSIRFRDMADFQWNTSSSTIMKSVRDHLLPMNFETIKQFRVSPETSYCPGMELMRPPRFTSVVVPQSYAYNQNPNIREEEANGEPILINFSRGQLTQTQYGDWASDTVPQQSNLAPSQNRTTRQCIEFVRKLFDEQPIWSRRALVNRTPKQLRNVLKFAYPHVSYYWKSGPWRDTCVKFGVDPRTDVKHAIYQVVAFKMDAIRSAKALQDETSHIFDGKTIVQDGRVYQFKDVTDPLVARLVNINGPWMRDTLDRRDGWYQNNRMFKIKYILRKKVNSLIAGLVPDDSTFESILRQPDHVNDWKEKYTKEGASITEEERLRREVEEEDVDAEDDGTGSEDDELAGEGVENDALSPDHINITIDNKINHLIKEFKQGSRREEHEDEDEDESNDQDEDEEDEDEDEEEDLALLDDDS